MGHIKWSKCGLNSKVHGANMGPIWDPQDPGGLHVGPMNFAVCGGLNELFTSQISVVV